MELLSARPESEMALGEIARRTGLNSSTCANILKTLTAEAYVEQVGYKRGYKPGPKLYFLVRHGSYRKDMAQVAYPLLQRLSDAIGETALVVTLFRNRRYLVQMYEANHDIRINSDMFLSNDVYTTATGHVLLANLGERDLESFLRIEGLPRPSQWPGAGSRKNLNESLRRIREQGFEKTAIGENIRAFAVPIRESDRVVAALGVPVPSFRYREENDTHLLGRMRTTVGRIEEALAKY